jgi:hypothetical protein
MRVVTVVGLLSVSGLVSSSKGAFTARVGQLSQARRDLGGGSINGKFYFGGTFVCAVQTLS